jgi:hypothetical protein
MENKLLIRILEILKKQTEEGHVDWETTAERDAFRASFNAGMVTVGSYIPESNPIGIGPFGNRVFYAQLHDDRGRLVDELQPEPAMQRSELLPTLHEMARRDALRPNDVADRLIKELLAADEHSVAGKT